MSKPEIIALPTFPNISGTRVFNIGENGITESKPGQIDLIFNYLITPEEMDKDIKQVKFYSQYIIYSTDGTLYSEFSVDTLFEIGSKELELTKEQAKFLLEIHVKDNLKGIHHNNPIKFPYGPEISIPDNASSLDMNNWSETVSEGSKTQRRTNDEI